MGKGSTVLSVFLSVVLVAGLCPAPAMADDASGLMAGSSDLFDSGSDAQLGSSDDGFLSIQAANWGLWPLPGYSKLSQGYGSGHEGIDIPAPNGTPVVAANDGTVVGTDMHSSYGNAVAILHSGGISTFYCHLNRRAVNGGASVSRGQVIGYVGSTGVSTGPHLHFRLNTNASRSNYWGKKQNPLNYVSPHSHEYNQQVNVKYAQLSDDQHTKTYTRRCACGATAGTGSEVNGCTWKWQGLKQVCSACGTEFVYHESNSEYITQRATYLTGSSTIPAGTVVKVSNVKKDSGGRWIGHVTYGGRTGYIRLSDCKRNGTAGKHSFKNGKCSQCGVPQVGTAPGVYKAKSNGEMYFQDVYSSKKKSFKKGDSIRINKVEPTTYNWYWGYTPDGYVLSMETLERNPVGSLFTGKVTTVPEGAYNIVCAANTGFALDIYQASKNNGAQLQLWTNNANPAQQFRIVGNGDGTYRIANVNSGMVFDVYGGGMANNTNVTQFEWHGGDNQRWYIEQNTDGTYSFRSKCNNLYLDIYGGFLTNKTPIHTYGGHGGYGQKFNLVPIGSTSMFAGNTVKVSGVNGSYGYTGSAISPRPRVMRQVYGNDALTVGSATSTADYQYLQACPIKKGVTYQVDVGSLKRVAGGQSKASMLVYDFGASKKGQEKQFAVSSSAQSYTFKADMAGTLLFYSAPFGQCSKCVSQWGNVRVYEVLEQGKNYTCSYRNNVAAGTATLTLKGAGGASGTRNITYRINKASLKGAKVSGLSARTYTGKAIAQVPTVRLGNRTLRYGTDFTVSYKNNVGNGKTATPATVVVSGKGNYAGTASGTFAIVPVASSKAASSKNATKPMYRMFNPRTGEHFYTASAKERDYLKTDPKGRWSYEGVGWNAPAASNGRPVYRLCYPKTGDHHYTMYASERDQMKKKGWRYEGVGWYSADPKAGRPLYRMFKPNMPVGAHHYTTSAAEKRDCLAKKGFRDEGVAWYGCK